MKSGQDWPHLYSGQSKLCAVSLQQHSYTSCHAQRQHIQSSGQPGLPGILTVQSPPPSRMPRCQRATQSRELLQTRTTETFLSAKIYLSSKFTSGGCFGQAGIFLELVQTTGLSATLTAFIKCAVVSRQRYPRKLLTTYGCESTTYGCKSSLCQNW